MRLVAALRMNFSVPASRQRPPASNTWCTSNMAAPPGRIAGGHCQPPVPPEPYVKVPHHSAQVFGHVPSRTASAHMAKQAIAAIVRHDRSQRVQKRKLATEPEAQARAA